LSPRCASRFCSLGPAGRPVRLLPAARSVVDENGTPRESYVPCAVWDMASAFLFAVGPEAKLGPILRHLATEDDYGITRSASRNSPSRACQILVAFECFLTSAIEA
jgi:hypothetical protein